jgi:hypothetical protein
MNCLQNAVPLMRRPTILLVSFLLCASPLLATEDDTKEQKQQGAPTYESPLLSLLFLPVNLLIKMASVMPKAPETNTRTAPSGTGK